jgi:amino acid adenylation domain-containing protein
LVQGPNDTQLEKVTRAGESDTRSSCIHTLFEEQMRRSPESVAVTCGEQRLTYRELDRWANGIAHRLVEQGVGPEALVGIGAGRSLEMVVGVVAILKAGGAYLPLDPSYPAERLRFMLADSGAEIALVEPNSGHLAGADVELIEIDGESEEEPPANDVEPSNLAYVIYTSGSTGRPKGVEVTHRAVVGLVCGQSYVPFGPERHHLCISPLAFDASTFDLWAPLLHGGRCVVFPEAVPTVAALERTMVEENVDTVFLTTSLFNTIIEEKPESLHTVKWLLTGGEAISISHVREALAALPEAAIVNCYGPTEATTFTTVHQVERPLPSEARTIPIGRPIEDTYVRVLSPTMEEVPVGKEGELYIGGPRVARGYRGHPGLTRSRFVPDPDGRAGDRLYRSGDLVRQLASGEIEFVGRIDKQVKLRGFRIEPGEVEAVLREHPEVRSAAVLVRGEGTAQRLVAYLVAANGGVDSAEMKRYAADRLPPHMVPGAIVELDSLPLTANGKLDRRRLPEPKAQVATAARRRPETEVERRLAEIWCSVLGVEDVGAEDDFFSLGADSLQAVRVIARVHLELGVELPLKAFLDGATVAELAERVEAGTADEAARLPEPRHEDRSASQRAGIGEERLWLLAQIQPESASAYNVWSALRIGGRLEEAKLQAALDEILARHESLRSRFSFDAGILRREIVPVDRFPLQVVECSEEQDARRLLEEAAAAPFDLDAPPLARALLVHASPQEDVLLVAMHHIASDGWSLSVLRQELAHLYGGSSEGLPELPLGYRDAVAWQRQLLDQEAFDPGLEFWREKLEGVPPALELPLDRPRPRRQSFRGGRVSLELEPRSWQELSRLAQEENATPFMVLLAAWTALLHRYSGQEDLVVGSPSSGRLHPATEGLIGFFVNTMPLRLRPQAQMPFRELLAQVRQVALAASDHQAVPFDKIVEQLDLPRDQGRPPLAQVFFAFQSFPESEEPIGGFPTSVYELHNGTAKFDAILEVTHRPHGTVATLEYATDLFEAETAARLLDHYQALLAAAIAEPQVPLSQLSLDRQERRTA